MEKAGIDYAVGKHIAPEEALLPSVFKIPTEERYYAWSRRQEVTLWSDHDPGSAHPPTAYAITWWEGGNQKVKQIPDPKNNLEEDEGNTAAVRLSWEMRPVWQAPLAGSHAITNKTLWPQNNKFITKFTSKYSGKREGPAHTPQLTYKNPATGRWTHDIFIYMDESKITFPKALEDGSMSEEKVEWPLERLTEVTITEGTTLQRISLRYGHERYTLWTAHPETWYSFSEQVSLLVRHADLQHKTAGNPPPTPKNR